MTITTRSRRKRNPNGLCSPEGFLVIGEQYLKQKLKTDLDNSDRRFRSIFGCSPLVCSIIFQMIVQNDLAPDCFTATYLTMGLLFLKVYASETIHAGIASVSEKTFRECSLIAVTAISDLYFLVVS